MAEAAQNQHGQVESAAVPGDQARFPLGHEVGEIGEHAQLVLGLADGAHFLARHVLV